MTRRNYDILLNINGLSHIPCKLVGKLEVKYQFWSKLALEFNTYVVQHITLGECMGIRDILFILFYVVAIAVVILHFTGWLEDKNMEWVVFVIAVLVFPVVLFL